MSNKTQELIKIITEHSDRELIFMYPDEGSDHAYTMGYPVKILVDEYWVDDERVWLKYDNEDELFDCIADRIFDIEYPDIPYANDEQIKEIEALTQKEIDEIEWKKAIVVYIHY